MPDEPESEGALVLLLIVLSLTTGLVDAISVLGLGKVFTANMTGNIVFLGFAVAGTPGFTVAPYLAALAAFLAGALAAGRCARRFADRPRGRTLLVAAAVEAALLFTAAALAVGYDAASLAPTAERYAIIALTGVAMGVRNATVRRLKIADMTTTVLTLTLTGLAADVGAGNPNWRRRIASVVAIFAGAALGAALVIAGGLAAPLALAGVLVLAATLVTVLLGERLRS